MDTIKEFWAQIMTVLAVLIWLARLEAAVRANGRELRRMQHQRNEDQAAHREAREATNTMLTEVRADIKELLRRKD